MGGILSSPAKNKKEEEQDEERTMTTTTKVMTTNDNTTKVDTNNNYSNDFIIRDGFPVLYSVPAQSSTNENSKDETEEIVESPPPLPQPNIDDVEPIPIRSFWSTLDDAPLLQISKTKDTTATTVQWEQLQHDCNIVFDARTRCMVDDDEDEQQEADNNNNKEESHHTVEEETEYSSGTTYFLPCTMEPRCTLEQIVQSIFHAHTQHLDPTTFRLEQSGAEWWTLVLNQNDENGPNGTSNNTKDDNDDDDDDDEVGLHFDADYGLEHQIRNMMIHPRLATVTYMSGISSSDSKILTPTIIYNIKSPNSLPNIAHRDPKVAFTSSVQPVDKIWISYPLLGKHIAFDGRLLHGASTSVFSTLAKSQNHNVIENDSMERPSKKHKTETTTTTTTTTNATTNAKMNSTTGVSKSTKQRITLMVNVWLNHCPLDAEPLDDEVIEKLITPFDSSSNEKTNKFPYWNESAVSLSRVVDAKDSSITNVDIMAKSKNVTARADEMILCNHNVIVTYDSKLVDIIDIYKNSKMDDCSNLQLTIKDKNMIQIEVHDEIPESDDDDNDKDGTDKK